MNNFTASLAQTEMDWPQISMREQLALAFRASKNKLGRNSAKNGHDAIQAPLMERRLKHARSLVTAMDP
jgi:hypothetical protein